MAKDPIMKTKTNDANDTTTAAADAGKPADASLTKSTIAKTTEHKEGGNSSVDAVSVQVALCTTVQGKQVPLIWGSDGTDVTEVLYTVSDTCGEDQGCPNSKKQASGAVGFQTRVRAGTMARIDASVTYSGAAEPVKCLPMIMSVACGEKNCSITMLAPPPPSQLTAAEAPQLILRTLWRTKGGDREEEGPEITAVNIKALGDATSDSCSRPVVQGSGALLKLVRDQTYEVMAEFREDYACACPPLPMHVHVCWEGTRELPIFLERCERMVALFFVDSCGRPVVPSDVLRDGQVLPMNVSQGGLCSFHAERTGRVRLSSQDCEFRPNEIKVDERMKQAHVIEAIRRTAVSAISEGIEEIFLEIAEEIKQGEQAFFKILALDGKLIQTVKADKGRAHLADLDHPCLIQAFVGGNCVGEQPHYPKRLAAGKAS
jgi:hypothetical protein